MADPGTEEKLHSELPPSSADKWFHCNAWRRLTWGLPDMSSEAAEEGTFAHEWFADHLLGKRDLADLDNRLMADHLFMCTEWIQEQQGELHVEQRVDFGAAFGFVDLTGTADAIIVSPKHMTVADLKYGRHMVDVDENLQLLCYLVGAVEKYGARSRYRLVILQPRAKKDDLAIREWFLDHAYLEQFKEKLEQAIQANFDPRSQPSVGEWCRKWCKALGRCPAAANKSLQMLRDFPEDDEADVADIIAMTGETSFPDGGA